jgi:hypothetical protein
MSFFDDAIIADFLHRLDMPNLTIVTSKRVDINDFETVAPTICRGLILKSYINSAIKNLIKFSERFEMVLLYETADMSNPISFLVVEKGECAKLPDAWSINLICAVETTTSGLKGCGQFLNGLYLYTIALNPFVLDKHGVLELANSFINAAGLASYSKLGFLIESSLYGESCFQDYNNLPMITAEINPERIIRILKGFPDAAYRKPKICDFRGPVQLYLGICLNLLTFLRYTPEELQEEFITEAYTMNDKRIINYKYLYDLIKDNIPAFEAMIDNIQLGTTADTSSFPGFLELETVLVTMKKRRRAKDTVVVDVGTLLRPRRANPLVGTRSASKKGGRRKTIKKSRRYTNKSVTLPLKI